MKRLRRWLSILRSYIANEEPDDDDFCFGGICNGVDVSHLKGLSPEEQKVEMDRIRKFDPYDPFDGWSEEEFQEWHTKVMAQPPIDLSKLKRLPEAE